MRECRNHGTFVLNETYLRARKKNPFFIYKICYLNALPGISDFFLKTAYIASCQRRRKVACVLLPLGSRCATRIAGIFIRAQKCPDKQVGPNS